MLRHWYSRLKHSHTLMSLTATAYEPDMKALLYARLTSRAKCCSWWGTPVVLGDINVVPSCDWVGSGVDTGTLGLYIHRYKWDWRTSQRKRCSCNSTGTYFVRSQTVRIAKRSHFWAKCCRGANALGWVFWRFGSAWATDRMDVVCTVVVSPAPQSAKNLLLQLWLGRVSKGEMVRKWLRLITGLARLIYLLVPKML